MFSSSNIMDLLPAPTSPKPTILISISAVHSEIFSPLLSDIPLRLLSVTQENRSNKVNNAKDNFEKNKLLNLSLQRQNKNVFQIMFYVFKEQS